MVRVVSLVLYGLVLVSVLGCSVATFPESTQTPAWGSAEWREELEATPTGERADSASELGDIPHRGPSLIPVLVLVGLLLAVGVALTAWRRR